MLQSPMILLLSRGGRIIASLDRDGVLAARVQLRPCFDTEEAFGGLDNDATRSVMIKPQRSNAHYRYFRQAVGLQVPCLGRRRQTIKNLDAGVCSPVFQWCLSFPSEWHGIRGV